MAKRDRQRLVRLLPYLGRDRKRLLLTLVLLIPVAGAAAVQPLLVGHPLSLRLDSGEIQSIVDQIASAGA